MAIRTLPVGSDSASRGPTCCGPGRVPVFNLKLLAAMESQAAHRDREEWGGLGKVQFDSERQPELRSGNLKGGSTVVAFSPLPNEHVPTSDRDSSLS